MCEVPRLHRRIDVSPWLSRSPAVGVRCRRFRRTARQEAGVAETSCPPGRRDPARTRTGSRRRRGTRRLPASRAMPRPGRTVPEAGSSRRSPSASRIGPSVAPRSSSGAADGAVAALDGVISRSRCRGTRRGPSTASTSAFTTPPMRVGHAAGQHDQADLAATEGIGAAPLDLRVLGGAGVGSGSRRRARAARRLPATTLSPPAAPHAGRRALQHAVLRHDRRHELGRLTSMRRCGRRGGGRRDDAAGSRSPPSPSAARSGSRRRTAWPDRSSRSGRRRRTGHRGGGPARRGCRIDLSRCRRSRRSGRPRPRSRRLGALPQDGTSGVVGDEGVADAGLGELVGRQPRALQERWSRGRTRAGSPRSAERDATPSALPYPPVARPPVLHYVISSAPVFEEAGAMRAHRARRATSSSWIRRALAAIRPRASWTLRTSRSTPPAPARTPSPKINSRSTRQPSKLACSASLTRIATVSGAVAAASADAIAAAEHSAPRMDTDGVDQVFNSGAATLDRAPGSRSWSHHHRPRPRADDRRLGHKQQGPASVP